MLLNYIKFTLTKELKDGKNVSCIVISQEIIDVSTANLILSKGVKKLINCVDTIYNSRGLTLIKDSNVEIIFIPKLIFKEISQRGRIEIRNNFLVYNNIYLPRTEPKIMDVEEKLDGFLGNTIEYMAKEKEIIKKAFVNGAIIKPLDVVIIISRGMSKKEDIAKAKEIIYQYNPTVIAVDGGADVAKKHGIKVDIIVGDMDSVSQHFINSCENILLHSYLSGICPGEDKIPIDKSRAYINCIGTSEDAAILFCIINNVSKIYTVGYHTSAKDFLEKGRLGASSFVLLRLIYGDRIIDIKNEVNFNRSFATRLFWIITVSALYLGFLLTLSTGVFK